MQEIAKEQNTHFQDAHAAIDTIRRSYLTKLHKKTGRNIIAYYSGFLSKPNNIDVLINDEDKNGFMMAIHNLDCSKGLDLILHTPGGDVAATESIVNYLHKMFGHNIRAVIPQIAMSAGTMLACSCKEILMAKHSNLGPIDPHLAGIPAHGVIEEFKRAYDEISKDKTGAKVVIWSQIISKYHPTFLIQCENAITWSKSFVKEQLAKVMFEGTENAKEKAEKITEKFSNFNENKTHARHFHIDECKKIGLNVVAIEDDQELQDLILTVHHAYMHSLMHTPACKIIENQNGAAFVKQPKQVAQVRQ